MKRVLITGVKGYLSTTLNYYFQENKCWKVTLLDLRDDNWRNLSFCQYDAIIHCAALVHKKEKNHSIQEYRDVNVVLTNDLALKAKQEGVKYFVFMSTRAVYGLEGSCFTTVVINENTVLNPKSKYGITKLEAEHVLREIESRDFKVCIIRSPFIYGPNCPGNYNTLRKLVLKVGLVPNLQNKYSMMYVGNLCSLISHCVEKKIQGIITPQDLPFHSTAEMALLIAKYNEKKVVYTTVFNTLIKLCSLMFKPIRTAFGNEIYDEKISIIEGVNYHVTEFEESIRVTEKQNQYGKE